MNINWKVRLKSGPFWVGLISLVLTLIYTLLNMAGIVPQFEQKQVMEDVYKRQIGRGTAEI